MVGYDVKVSSLLKRRLSGPARRLKLIEAATLVFASKGYDGATVEEIAFAGSVTKPVVYDHFASKQEIFAAAIEKIRDHLLEMGRAAISKENAPDGKLIAAISVFFDLVQHHPESARVLLISSKAPSSIADLCRRIQGEATAGIAQIMRMNSASQGKRSERQWYLKAEFAKKGMHGLAEWWLEHPDVPRTEIEEAISSTLTAGIHGTNKHPRTDKLK